MNLEPSLIPIDIADLRPTQITVGMREVEERRALLRSKAEDGDKQFLGRHMIPVVQGPKKRPYLIDHHHLALALRREGQTKVLTMQIADLSRLDKQAFWVFLDNRGWLHPFDAEGRRLGYDEIPRSVSDLVDDPYRSLAGALRRAGGFAKDTTPFSEFLWADFLRRRVAVKRIERDFEGALEEAMAAARSRDADFLPGWCGPHAANASG